MDAVRITDFVLLNSYEERDIIHLQRQEAGVWNDYHTDLGSYFGQVKTYVYDWDLNLALLEVIPCPPGKYIVMIAGHILYKAGSAFGFATGQVQLFTTNTSYIAEFQHNGTDQGSFINPLFGTGPSSNIYGDLSEDINVGYGCITPGTPDQGRVRIVVQYVEVTPI